MSFREFQYFSPDRADPDLLSQVFVDRDNLLNDIRDLLRRREADDSPANARNKSTHSTNHAILVGSSGCGKTTFIYRLKYSVQSTSSTIRWLPIVLDQEYYSITKAKDLLDHLLSAVQISIRARIAADDRPETTDRQNQHRSVGDVELGTVNAFLQEYTHQKLKLKSFLTRLSPALADFQNAGDDDSLLRITLALLQDLFSSCSVRILVLLENIDRILSNLAATDAFEKYCSLFKTDQLFFVGTSTTPADRLGKIQVLRSYEYILDSFRQFELRPFTLEESHRALVLLAESTGRTRFLSKMPYITPRINALYELTQGNPRLTALMFDILKDRDLTVSRKGLLLDREIDELIDRLTPLFQNRMSGLSAQAARVVRTLALEEGGLSPTEVAERLGVTNAVARVVLRRLEMEGHLKKGHRAGRVTYRVEDPLFRIWHQISRTGTRSDQQGLFAYRFLVNWYEAEEAIVPPEFGLADRSVSEVERNLRSDYGTALDSQTHADVAADMEYVALWETQPRRLRRLFRRMQEHVAPGDDASIEDRFVELDEENRALTGYFFWKGLFLATHAFNHRSAVTAFRKALTLEPNDALVLYNFGVALGRIRMDCKADYVYERVCASLAPQSVRRSIYASQDFLLHRISADTDHAYGLVAAYLLGRSGRYCVAGREELKDRIRTALRAASDPGTCERCIVALGLLQCLEAAKEVKKYVFSRHTSLAQLAIRALGQMRAECATPPLLDVFQKSYSALPNEEHRRRYARMKAEAALALGRIGAKVAREPLIRSLTDRFAVVRAGSADALGTMKYQEAVGPLIHLLEDENTVVRGRAAAALGRIPTSESAKSLISCLDDSFAYVQSRAAASLGYLYSSGAIAPLFKLMENTESDDVKCKSSLALCRLAKYTPSENLGKAVSTVLDLAHQRAPERAASVARMVLCYVFMTKKLDKAKVAVDIVEQDTSDEIRAIGAPYRAALSFLLRDRRDAILDSEPIPVQKTARELIELHFSDGYSNAPQ